MAGQPADDLDDPSSPNPSASPSRDTEYTLTFTDAMGFAASDTVRITCYPRVRRRLSDVEPAW